MGASVVPVFRAGTGFKTRLTRVDGVSRSPGSAAVEGGLPRAKGKKSQAAASGSPAGTVVVAADAAADDRKKAGKKARDQAEANGSKSARKAAKTHAAKNKAGKNKAGKNKAGKEVAKGLR